MDFKTQDWQNQILEREGFNNNKTTNTTIMTYGVFYVATREAKTFAGMQDELIATFNNFNDAVDMANSETYLDEMHDGYVVRNL